MQTISNAIQDYMGPVETATSPTYKHRPGGETMRALAWFGKEDMRIVDAPIPDVSEPKDVIIKVTGTTICGSDLHLYHSEMLALQKGDILGHEFMGIVDRVGEEVKTLAPGDKVVVSFQTACGTCRYCQKKLSSFCERTNNSSLMASMYGQRDAGFFGYGHMTGGLPGGQSEYVRVPFGEVNCMKVPEGVADEQALYLSDILPTSYHAVVDTGVQKGDVVGIWGLGPIGLCCIKWALLKGASKVYAIDTVPTRLAMAKAIGPEVITVDFKAEDVSKTIHEAVPEGLDVCIDATTFHEPKTMLHKVEKALMLETDVCETPNEMIFLVKKMGRVGLIGVYSGYTNHFNIGALMEKGVRFIGNGQAPVHLYWEEIMEYLKDGTFDTKFLVTHRVSLEDFPALYNSFDKRHAGVSKVFVETKASEAPSPGYPQLSKVADWAKVTM